jgi:formylglycine-generating enzyme required for sulfatase activity
MISVVVQSPLRAAETAKPHVSRQDEIEPSCPLSQAKADLEMVNFKALRMAVQDIIKTFPGKYPRGPEFLNRIEACEKRLPKIQAALKQGNTEAISEVETILALQREALLANPLMNFDKLLLIKRKPHGDPRRAKAPDRGVGEFIGLPRQSSWQLHTMKNTDKWQNEITVLSPVHPQGELSILYKSPGKKLISEMDLHFDADKLMFSMPDSNKIWQIFEIDADGGNLKQISLSDQPDVHSFDSCYLPNGKIAFISTAVFQGVPCNASVNVGMTYLMDADGRKVRQICFEQDHNFCPTVMNDGRILYLRWEYTDIPHVWARFLFTMNPDGTGQREFYGSGGYWPNAIFYARPIPGHPTKVVSIVTGHHVGRVGELVIFDPALGRKSNDGVVQRIPGYGKKVEPLIMDKLTIDSFPKFLHPYPLSEKYFIVSAKPRPRDLWGIYLVDIFDNIVLLKEVEDYALVEPIPFRRTRKPPVIADMVNLERKDALVYLEDIYSGPGLNGVPRGSVKNLRLFTYQFAYRKVAGINHRVGADGPWEPKRIIGTVPVEKDGSAFFRIPANTPISIQPTDDQGKAFQLMRSWMTAMPGEFVSCTGCHEQQNATPSNRVTIASRRKPSEIKPWYGPTRGFSFKREVQPVLDWYCVTCHDGGKRDDGKTIPDLRADQGKFIVYKNGVPKERIIYGVPRRELVKKYGGVFEPSYITLRSYIRVGGLESDLRLLAPGEFHADNTELFQMLRKGHHGVQLDREAWERLAAWIDLNAPCHGTWSEVVGLEKTAHDRRRRCELQKLYANIDEDSEVIPEIARKAVEPIRPQARKKESIEVPKIDGWPFDENEARLRQAANGQTERTIDLGNGVKLDFVLIPAGEFIMGDQNGCDDEQPLTPVKISKPFWMSKFEVTNEQYAQFDSSHDSKYEHKGSWMFNEWDLGWSLNEPRQPVVRISWEEAMAFCKWLSQETGLKFSLPTEAQWEFACRAGTTEPLFYGGLDDDFSEYANMADMTMKDLVYDARDQYSPDLVPRDNRSNDSKLVASEVGSYKANSWGLHDMHGNVWEWTRSAHKTYPYKTDDGRNDMTATGEKVVRGGSWYDRPKRCRSAFRLNYPAWRKVFNIGFRVIIDSDKDIPVVEHTFTNKQQLSKANN